VNASYIDNPYSAQPEEESGPLRADAQTPWKEHASCKPYKNTTPISSF
jgi:hypothetical protein